MDEHNVSQILIADQGTPPPDGKYVASITGIKTYFRHTPKKRIAFRLKIEQGQYQGICILKVSHVHTEDGQTQFTKEMRQIGLTIGSVEDIARNEDVFRTMLVNVIIRHGNGNGNLQVYFLSRY